MSVPYIGAHATPHQADPSQDSGGFCSSLTRIMTIGLGALSILASYLMLYPLSATVISGIIGLIGLSVYQGSGASSAQRTNAAYQSQGGPARWWNNINPAFLWNHAFNPLTSGGMMGGHAVPGQRAGGGNQGGHALPGQRGGTQARGNTHAIPGQRGTQPNTGTGHAIPGARTH